MQRIVLCGVEYLKSKHPLTEKINIHIQLEVEVYSITCLISKCSTFCARDAGKFSDFFLLLWFRR